MHKYLPLVNVWPCKKSTEKSKVFKLFSWTVLASRRGRGNGLPRRRSRLAMTGRARRRATARVAPAGCGAGHLGATQKPEALQGAASLTRRPYCGGERQRPRRGRPMERPRHDRRARALPLPQRCRAGGTRGGAEATPYKESDIWGGPSQSGGAGQLPQGGRH